LAEKKVPQRPPRWAQKGGLSFIGGSNRVGGGRDEGKLSSEKNWKKDERKRRNNNKEKREREK